MVILAGEINKTEIKLAIFDHHKDTNNKIIIPPGFQPIIQSFEIKYEISELQNIIENFLDKNNNIQKEIYGVSFSIAAPLINKEKAKLSHNSKTITFTKEDLRKKLPCPNVPIAFLNDMEAIGYYIFLEGGESKLQKVHDPKLINSNENRALMLVSDGLGASVWYCFDDKKGDLIPIASEWGHQDFAANNDQEKKLKEYLKDKKGNSIPISKEDILSKNGLIKIYEVLQNPNPESNKEDFSESNTDIIINKILQGCSSGDSLCQETLNMFMGIWGAEAGNLALTFNAKGGVYIATDLNISIDKFQESRFWESFINKEPEFMDFKKILQKTPIKLLQEPNAGIWGAAQYAIKSGFVTKGKFAIMRARQ